MAVTMMAEVEFLFFFGSMVTSCALSLCACGRRIWDSELLRPLFMLSESRGSHWHRRCWLKLSFRVFFVKWWPAVPIHFARAGVVFECLYFWGNFSCSVKGQNPNGIDDVGWGWVFDLFLLNDDQLCLITFRLRASYLRVWTFEATCLWEVMENSLTCFIFAPRLLRSL